MLNIYDTLLLHATFQCSTTIYQLNLHIFINYKNYLRINIQKTVDKYCGSDIIKTNGNDYGNDNGNDNINRNKLEDGEMSTIKDIARISGYSTGTVSRVINNRADVSEEARKKIEEVIREQNYQPNQSARMLRQTVSSEVSIIVRGVGNVFLESLLEKVQIRVREQGETVNVQFIGETEDEIAAAEQVVQQLKPKGLIFLGGSLNTFRKEFSRIGLPSVLTSVDAGELGFENLSSFTTDDVDAGAYAVRKLVELGHRRIGLVGGYPGDISDALPYDCSTLRLYGAAGELRRSGIAFAFESDYEESPYSAEGGYKAAERLLLRKPDLTGIFALSDSMALGAIRAIQDKGLRVPEDISVVGFDGIDYGRYSNPRLATIRQDIEMLARKSVDDLLLRISYGAPAVHEQIPYMYVDGESVAQPRK